MPYATLEKYIKGQVMYWQQQKEKLDSKAIAKSHLPFITISREYGCGGFEIGRKIAEILNVDQHQNPPWVPYDRQLLDNLMEDTGLSQNLLDTLTSNARNQLTNLLQTSFSKFPPQITVYKKLAETVALLAANGNSIIIGRAGNAITRHIEGGYHVRIVARMELKTATIMKKTGLAKREAEKLVVERNEERDRFIKDFVKFDVEDPHNYHLFINLSLHSVDEVARIIIEGMKQKGILKI